MHKHPVPSGTHYVGRSRAAVLRACLGTCVGEVIRHHQYPGGVRDYSGLTHIVYLADLLMSLFHTGLELERINTGSPVERLQKLNLRSSDFQKTVDLIPDTVFQREG